MDGQPRGASWLARPGWTRPRRSFTGSIQGAAAWSPDDRRIAFGDPLTIAVFELEAREETVFELDELGIGLTRDDPQDRLWALTWSPDGVAIEFATRRALWRLDIESGVAVKIANGPRPGAFTQGTVLSYAPDGETLVAATQFGVFALEDGETWRLLSRVGVPVFGGSLHWSPGSSAVADAGEAPSSGGALGIIVAPLDGSGAYQLVAPGAGRVLGWLDDGRIYYTSTTGGV